MKAITLEQPAASLIAIGVKRIATRPTATAYRGPMLIHTAMRASVISDPYCRSVLISSGLNPSNLPRGVLLAHCTLNDCRQITAANCPCYPEYAFGNFQPGWYAWYLSDIRRLDKSLPARGYPGLWDFSE